MKRTILLLLLILLASCSSQRRQSQAEDAMRSFFRALASEDYEAAVNLYGGDYETLIQMNPSVSPADRVALWRNGCEFNGFVCMEVLNVLSVAGDDSQIEFNVTFKTGDGELFQFTGCCGETLAEPITEYIIRVEAGKGRDHKVLTMPPYIP